MTPSPSAAPPLPSSSAAPASAESENSGGPVAPPAAAAPGPAFPDATTTAPTTGDTGAPVVTAATLHSMAALDDRVQLEPGDRVSFRVIEDQDQAVPLVVTDNGEVDFPYVGRVKVQGKTCKQVAYDLKGLLEVDYYKRATVILGLDTISAAEGVAHDMVWVVGQVRQVGPQELSKQQALTVSQVILRAGGFGDFADQRRVRLIHRDSSAASAGADGGAPPPVSSTDKGQIIDVKAVFDGKSSTDPEVSANDLIVVPKRLVNF